MRAYERLLRYAAIDTQSDESSGTAPSTARQLTLARLLEKELRELGCRNVRLDPNGIVYGELPASAGYDSRVRLGFLAHMDTSPDCSGAGVRPRLIPDYKGGAVELGHGRVLSPAMFPHLGTLRGRTLITAGGDTLLGADDKAGIAEILTLLERLQTENIPHGAVPVAFTPDEEIGRGADHFDVAAFGADFAYTVDGDTEGTLEYENFNAASAVFSITGRGVHPGSAKGVMVNAALIAAELAGLLPPKESPAETEGYEGFYHLTGLSGGVEHAEVSVIVRDHDAARFAARCERLRAIAETLNARHGAGTVTLSLREQYRNMAERILPHRHLIDFAVEAARTAGVTPQVHPIRGGTDGARLSYMGLPCPNLGTGGHAFHGPYEHITVEGMDRVVDILTALTARYAAYTKDALGGAPC